MHLLCSTDAIKLTDWTFYMIRYGMTYLLVWATGQFAANLVRKLSVSARHPDIQLVFLSLPSLR